jgi:hypothetical protein
VSSVFPSPVAPKLRTSKIPDADATDDSRAAAAIENAGTPATAAPMPPIRKTSRRIASNDLIFSLHVVVLEILRTPEAAELLRASGRRRKTPRA